MKKITIIFFLALSSLVSFAQKGWVKQTLNNKLTVSFPTAPKQTAGTTYALRDSTGVIYTATYSQIGQILKIDHRAFPKLVATNEFASDFLSSLQTTLGNYNLSDISIKQHKNYVSYTTKGINEVDKKSIFLNIIFVDGAYYSLSVAFPNKVDEKQKNSFLNNFQLIDN